MEQQFFTFEYGGDFSERYHQGASMVEMRADAYFFPVSTVLFEPISSRTLDQRSGGPLMGEPFASNAGAGVDWAAVRGMVRRFVYGRTHNSQTADDVAQEVLLRAIEYRQSKPLNSPFAFALMTARNLLNDSARLAKPMVSDEVLSSYAGNERPDELYERRSEMQAMLAVIQAMPPLRKEVFWRKRIRGQSCAEIAQALGLNAKAVEKHITRAMVDLHQARQSVASSDAKVGV